MSETLRNAANARILNNVSSTERFSGRATTYDRFRQRYPETEILSLLRDWCRLESSWKVADIGAGTGMLTEVFLANGNSVLAIEPNREMRSIAMQLLQRFPLLQIRDATAEETGIATGSIDLVAAGRAFHWFDVPRATEEFRRILKPRGWMVLVSLGRANDAADQAQEFEQLLHTYGTDYSYIRRGYRVHESLSEVFGADMRQAQLASEMSLDWESFLGQTMSLSVTPQTEDPRYPNFMEALRSYFDTYAIEHRLTVPTTCWVTVGRFSIR